MGQYYRPIILKQDFRTSYKDKKAKVVINSWDYGCGAKLMENAWINNPICRICEGLLANRYYGYPFVWCGDYADDIRLYIENLNEKQFKEKYGDEDEKAYLPYDFEDELAERPEFSKELPHYRYIINLSKKQYVDLNKIVDTDEHWGIHPLPLLCANGNQRGGGDYYGADIKIVGTWAYDNIGVGNEVPVGFGELETHFS